ncbi:hypothetical protein [Halovenus salina]|uniref:Uncharacterized protein n=1 Tax=Halovenus salina TaxID=1510225 RepID=A0ABD5W0B9_9EURY|nr:hypothetical protein [Halovenus salina]
MTVSVSAVAAGCLGLGGGDDTVSTEGNDDSPFEMSPESLLLGKEALTDETDEDWNEEDPQDGFGLEAIENTSVLRDVDAVRLFGPQFSEDGGFDLKACASTVRLYDTVEAAQEAFDNSPFQSGFGYESRQIAVESIGGTTEGEESHIIFRDANAIGDLVYTNQESDDRKEQTALDLAAAMHQSWR